MKKYINIFVVLIVCMLWSCNTDPEEGNTPKPSFNMSLLQKEWQLETWQGNKSELEVYIEFKADNTFTIFQQIETIRFLVYNGTYRVDGATISGKYNDGQSWGDEYTLTFEQNRGTMLMTSQYESSQYVECEIPTSVKESAEEYKPTKINSYHLL